MATAFIHPYWQCFKGICSLNVITGRQIGDADNEACLTCLSSRELEQNQPVRFVFGFFLL